MSLVNTTFFVMLSFFCVLCQRPDTKITNLNLTEGSECGYRAQEGVCASIYKCLSVLIRLDYKDYPPLCSFKGDVPIVCCTDCELMDDLRNAVYILELGIYRRNNGRVSNRKCLQYLEKLPYNCKTAQPALNYDMNTLFILPSDPDPSGTSCYRFVAAGLHNGITGDRIMNERFPHIALLGYGEDRDSAKYHCGGTIISEKFILTAAHCITNLELGPVKYVAVGVQKRTDSPESWQRYDIKKVIPYPQYKSPSKYHDIALLELEEEINFDETVLPACINLDIHDYYEEVSYDLFFKTVREVLSRRVVNTTYALAWGIVGNNLEPDENLQKIELERYSDGECSKLYPVHRHMDRGYDSVTQMCYRDYQGGADGCMVESGSALQKSIRANVFDCQYKVLGVVSSGSPCGTKGGAGLYTKVDYYIPWIESVVWPDEK